MTKSLSEIAHIFNGTDYKKNPPGEIVPIYGTGGLMGFTSISLYNGPAVLSGRKGSINNPIYVDGPFWNVDTIFCIKANEGINTKWLYYHFLNTDLSQLNEATGVPSVNSKSLYKLKFHWFEFPEQTQIAQILGTADAVIEKTQVAIAKYKAIKQGMLHDLFTRGIDIETGKLRPRYEDAPELYKESKLGWIPMEWDVDESKNLVKFINGRAYSLHEWETNGTPVIRLQNLTGSGETYYYSNLKLPDEQYCLKDDLLYMWSATFGPHIWDGEKAIYHYHIWKVECMKNMLQEYFYYDLLRFTETVLSGSNGSTMAHITKEGMDKRKTIMPSLVEQNMISQRLKNIDNNLKSEQTYLHKLQQIKAGLMGDLLSGKKEVKMEEEPTTEAPKG